MRIFIVYFNKLIQVLILRSFFLIGGNNFPRRYKRNTVLESRSAGTVHATVHVLYDLTNRLSQFDNVYILGVPSRYNDFFDDIKVFNRQLCTLTQENLPENMNVFHFIGVGKKMASNNIIDSDGVHLTDYSRSQLAKLFNEKVIRKYLFAFQYFVYYFTCNIYGVKCFRLCNGISVFRWIVQQLTCILQYECSCR